MRIADEEGVIQYELYDVGQDPEEASNLYNIPSFTGEVEELKADLEAWSETHCWGG